MRVAFVATDIPGIVNPYMKGGVATFIDHLTALLHPLGDELKIVIPSDKLYLIREEWQQVYRERDIDISFAIEPRAKLPIYPAAWPLRLAEEVAGHVADADVVYLQDWGGFGLHAIRSGRFSRSRRPCFVNVLHGASGWIQAGSQLYPEIPYNLVLNFIEGYSTRHSDFVASPSRYMLEYVTRIGWSLPPLERVRVLGLPLVTHPPKPGQSGEPRTPFRKLVFFGRLETRKGFEVFVDALLLLARERPHTLAGLEQVVLLGHEAESRIGSSQDAARVLGEVGLQVKAVGGLDSPGAQQYLAAHSHDALVVIPSLLDNHPYAVVETSLIQGLNLICSSVGGIPEILGEGGAHQLFEPTAPALAAKLSEWLDHGRVEHDAQGHYDPGAANERWLSFHQEVCEFAANRTPKPEAATPRPARSTRSLDVCVPYFNHAAYLPQLLLSLEHQTSADFNVIVVDDGSTAPDADLVFDAMRERYAARGWRFIRQEHAFVDAARNNAARQGEAPFLCFLDADDVAAPNLVERLLDAIELSGDDCLMTCYALFEGQRFPIELSSGLPTVPAIAYKRPLGVDPLVSLVDPDVLGSPVMIVRRSAYESVGGFTEISGAGHEDYELYVKLGFAGFRVDVLPEHLQYKREIASSLGRTMDLQRAKLRIIGAYEERLRGTGLEGMALALFSAARESGPPRDQDAAQEDPPRGLRALYHARMPMRIQRLVRRARLRLTRTDAPG